MGLYSGLIGMMASIVSLLVTVRRDQTEREREPNDKVSRRTIEREYHQRSRLLNRLDLIYKDYLNQSLERTIPLQIAFDQLVGKASQGLTQVLPVLSRDKTIIQSTSLLDLFERYGGLKAPDILLLGEPGAGKTTALIEFASCITERARAELQHPIPVYLPLSTWRDGRTTFVEWMVKQLAVLYQVPSRLAKHWIEEDQLLFLLDGLDEISDHASRIACIKQLNAFVQEHPV
ncbi:MAG TPA: NACHT domain-containing protein, partial [Acidimicrobiales bacterium]|nr:NACHT domain-containing protein [Acidimicrobiales bacterium]